jgi:hypothetical protein
MMISIEVKDGPDRVRIHVRARGVASASEAPVVVAVTTMLMECLPQLQIEGVKVGVPRGYVHSREV